MTNRDTVSLHVRHIYIIEYIWCNGGRPRVVDLWLTYSELAVCLQNGPCYAKLLGQLTV